MARAKHKNCFAPTKCPGSARRDKLDGSCFASKRSLISPCWMMSSEIHKPDTCATILALKLPTVKSDTKVAALIFFRLTTADFAIVYLSPIRMVHA